MTNEYYELGVKLAFNALWNPIWSYPKGQRGKAYASNLVSGVSGGLAGAIPAALLWKKNPLLAAAVGLGVGGGVSQLTGMGMEQALDIEKE